MNKTWILLAIVALVAACRGGGAGSLQRKDQQNYDVVQEGQASGVTSTINAPGEVPPPAAMTGTNYDTTSNFNLPGVAPATTSTQAGTLAGSMQYPPSASMASPYPMNPPQPRRRVERPVPPEPETHTTDPSTSTSVEGAPTTTENTPPLPSDKPKDKPKDQDKPPSTDTQPPPTTTTT